jgi:hypothetical protein
MEIEVTQLMIDAGVSEAREHCLGETLASLVSRIYLAMSLEKPTRQVPQLPRRASLDIQDQLLQHRAAPRSK